MSSESFEKLRERRKEKRWTTPRPPELIASISAMAPELDHCFVSPYSVLAECRLVLLPKEDCTGTILIGTFAGSNHFLEIAQVVPAKVLSLSPPLWLITTAPVMHTKIDKIWQKVSSRPVGGYNSGSDSSGNFINHATWDSFYCITDALAARATISAQETTLGHASSSWAFISSSTSNPLREFIFGTAFFSLWI